MRHMRNALRGHTALALSEPMSVNAYRHCPPNEHNEACARGDEEIIVNYRALESVHFL